MATGGRGGGQRRARVHVPASGNMEYRDGGRHQPCILVEMSSGSCRGSEGAAEKADSRPPPSVSVEEFYPPG